MDEIVRDAVDVPRNADGINKADDRHRPQRPVVKKPDEHRPNERSVRERGEYGDDISIRILEEERWTTLEQGRCGHRAWCFAGDDVGRWGAMESILFPMDERYQIECLQQPGICPLIQRIFGSRRSA